MADKKEDASPQAARRRNEQVGTVVKAKMAKTVVVAVEREMRRQAAEQDAQVLRERGPADDLDDLVQWSSTHLEVED